MSETGELPITPPPPKSPAGNAPTAPAATGISLANLGGRSPDRAAGQEQGNGQSTPEQDAQAAEAQRLHTNTAAGDEIRSAVGDPADANASDKEVAELAGSPKTAADIQAAQRDPSDGSSIVPPASEGGAAAIRVPVLTADANPLNPTAGDSSADVDQSQQASGEKLPDDNTSAIPGDEIDASVTPPPGSPPPASPAGGMPPTNGQPDGAEPASLPGSPEDATQSVEPGAPPPDAEDGESGSENGEIEPAPDQGNEGTTQQNPDVQKTPEQIQKDVEKKIADDELASKVQSIIEKLPEDSEVRKAYEEMKKEYVSEELSKTIEEMSTYKEGKRVVDLQTRIDEARSAEVPKRDKDGKEIIEEGKVVMEKKNEELTLAHVLEERRDRIKEIQDQAARQAALDLLKKYPQDHELQSVIKVEGADPAKVQAALESASKEADARRVLASGELQAEKGRAKGTEDFAKSVDKANADKKTNEAKIRTEQLNILRELTQQEGLQALVDGLSDSNPDTARAARNRLELLRQLAHQDGHPLSRNALLKDAKDFSDLEQRIRQRGEYLQEKRRQYTDARAKKTRELMDIAKKADDAKDFNDAKLTYEAKLDRRMALMDLEAQRAAGMITEEQYQEQKARINRIDELSKEDEEKADKQVKQRFKNYARRWNHSRKEWGKAREDLKKARAKDRSAQTDDEKKEAKKAIEDAKKALASARGEFWLSTRAVGKEALLTGLKWWGFWQLVMYLTIIAVEVRMAGKMFGQDGK